MSGEYPENEKWRKLLEEQGRTIINFLQWLEDQEIELAKYGDSEKEENENRLYPFMESSEKILYRYGNIDPQKLEDERQQMINSLQNNG